MTDGNGAGLSEIVAAFTADNGAGGRSVQIKRASPADGMIANPQPAKPAKQQRGGEPEREEKDQENNWRHVKADLVLERSASIIASYGRDYYRSSHLAAND
jgi:hypothetical protein